MGKEGKGMMESLHEDKEIDLKELITIAYEVKRKGYRLIQICCTSLKERYILNYSFAKNYDFTNYKIQVDINDDIPSISGIYKYAYLYENEMKDLFGINISNIDIDFKGHLYDLGKKTPYKINISDKKGGEKK